MRPAGLFRILFWSITTVSAVTTTSSFIVKRKYSAFFSARYLATWSTGRSGGKDSSTSGFSVVKLKPASFIKYWRRGELEATIKGLFMNEVLECWSSKCWRSGQLSAISGQLVDCYNN